MAGGLSSVLPLGRCFGADRYRFFCFWGLTTGVGCCMHWYRFAICSWFWVLRRAINRSLTFYFSAAVCSSVALPQLGKRLFLLLRFLASPAEPATKTEPEPCSFYCNPLHYGKNTNSYLSGSPNIIFFQIILRKKFWNYVIFANRHFFLCTITRHSNCYHPIL